MSARLVQAWTLVTLSLVLGLALNRVRCDPLPLLTSLELRVGRGALSVDQAYQYQRMRRAFFVDARSPQEFRAGHLPQAGNLPAFEFESHAGILERVSKGFPLIVYCEDSRCGAEQRVARKLEERGYYRVYTMPEGVAGWRKRGLQLERER